MGHLGRSGAAAAAVGVAALSPKGRLNGGGVRFLLSRTVAGDALWPVLRLANEYESSPQGLHTERH